MWTQQRTSLVAVGINPVSVFHFISLLVSIMNQQFVISFQPTIIISTYYFTKQSIITTATSNPHSSTALHGIDFNSIEEFEECDFTDGDLSNVDLSKCLPFPSVHIEPEDVVRLCMDSLLINDEPKINAGLEVCYNFSSDKLIAGKNRNVICDLHFV